jgi:hypothetical protein
MRVNVVPTADKRPLEGQGSGPVDNIKIYLSGSLKGSEILN